MTAVYAVAEGPRLHGTAPLMMQLPDLAVSHPLVQAVFYIPAESAGHSHPPR